MSELFVEFICEEIPARMQKGGGLEYMALLRWFQCCHIMKGPVTGF